MKISSNNNVLPVKQQSTNNRSNIKTLNGNEPDTFRRSGTSSSDKVQFKGWLSDLFKPVDPDTYIPAIKSFLKNDPTQKGKEALVDNLVDNFMKVVPKTEKRGHVLFDMSTYLDDKNPKVGARLTANLQKLSKENPGLPRSIEENPIKALIHTLLIPHERDQHDIFSEGFVRQYTQILNDKDI